MSCLEVDSVLYHGSSEIVKDVDVSRGEIRKDFGQGFYTTSSKIQAEKFAVIKAKRINRPEGFVSVFQYEPNLVNIVKVFDAADSGWLSYVMAHRGLSEAEFSIGTEDIVIGPVANDRVGATINNFIAGVYGNPKSKEAQDITIQLLKTQNLHNQVFFRTKSSASYLKFKEAYKVEVNG